VRHRDKPANVICYDSAQNDNVNTLPRLDKYVVGDSPMCLYTLDASRLLSDVDICRLHLGRPPEMTKTVTVTEHDHPPKLANLDDLARKNT